MVINEKTEEEKKRENHDICCKAKDKKVNKNH